MIMFAFSIFFLVVCLFLIIALFKATFVVQQAEVVIVERFGKFHRILDSGIHFIIPFMDQTRSITWTFVKTDPRDKHYYRYTEQVQRIDMREAVYDFPKQNVITKDNVTMEINALLYYQITDPKSAVYEVSNLPQAIEKLTQTTLRNVIGSLDLDETLTSRDKINEKLRVILDEATDKWGVKVNRVELQEVTPPVDIREAMEKQMRAERDRRALILEAEGKKSADVLESEGYKQALITRAEGEAQARITNAQAEAQARVAAAQAEAQAIETIKRVVPNTDPLAYMVAINYIKMLPEMTKDKEGKMIILPYESSAMMGSLAAIKGLFESK
jgi:regulator of protease activity HflC (stomatin/prohibitin superfamily)